MLLAICRREPAALPPDGLDATQEDVVLALACGEVVWGLSSQNWPANAVARQHLHHPLADAESAPSQIELPTGLLTGLLTEMPIELEPACGPTDAAFLWGDW